MEDELRLERNVNPKTGKRQIREREKLVETGSEFGHKLAEALNGDIKAPAHFTRTGTAPVPPLVLLGFGLHG